MTFFDKVHVLIITHQNRLRSIAFEFSTIKTEFVLFFYYVTRNLLFLHHFFFKCTWGTELSVKTRRTAPNCTITARPTSTNYQSTFQCFHKKCTKCAKCTRGTDLSVKTSQTAPNCTRTARLISTKFKSS